MNQEENKKGFGAKYIILGIFILVYIISVVDAIYASIHDLYAMFMSLFINVPLGIILGTTSIIIKIRSLNTGKRQKIFTFLGMTIGFLGPIISIIWFFVMKSKLGY
ncbi:MAG: hypothetical protein AAB595_01320 [Patescibacteria group bacterium]